MIPVTPITTFVSEKLIHIQEIEVPEKKIWTHYITEMYVTNLIKIFEVYFTAFLLGCVRQTFITHLTFLCLRRYCYGRHAQASWTCSFQSLLLFCIIPFISGKFELLLTAAPVLLLTCGMMILFFAPQLTENSPDFSEQERVRLKRRALIAFLSILILFSIIRSSFIRHSIVCGTLAQLVLLIPFPSWISSGLYQQSPAARKRTKK